MVVAPYNAQVNALREALPESVRVGTVDKFQGQEADVVLYSMASSSGEDVPRGLEFLLSRNRLNVAISRARCLAYLVASPRLLEVNCSTIPQMRLANALCRFVELATQSAQTTSRPIVHVLVLPARRRDARAPQLTALPNSCTCYCMLMLERRLQILLRRRPLPSDCGGCTRGGRRAIATVVRDAIDQALPSGYRDKARRRRRDLECGADRAAG